MEKIIAYCQFYLYLESGFVCFYLFKDITGLALLCAIISQGIIYYLSVINPKSFSLIKSVFYNYSLFLIVANLYYLSFDKGIFDYKEFSNRLYFSLWFVFPLFVIDLFRKKNWE